MSGHRSAGKRSQDAAKAIALTIVGWVLVLAGIAAIFLPGPGLLALVGGLAVLSTQYEWAERRLEPVKVRAFKAAADGVQSWPRIIASTVAALLLGAIGVVWGIGPDTPGWWPIDEKWWLLGGWGTGATLIFSAIIALGFMVYSFRRFRGRPDHQEAAEQAARED